MLVPIVRIAAAALAGSVSYNTGRNVYETIQCTIQPQAISAAPLRTAASTTATSFDMPPTNGIVEEPTTISATKTTTTTTTTTRKIPLPQTVGEIQKLSRRELLDIYINDCIVPTDMSMFDGEWHGKLLNNNGLVRGVLFRALCSHASIDLSGYPLTG
jgi:hypothetical protein